MILSFLNLFLFATMVKKKKKNLHKTYFTVLTIFKCSIE